MQNQSVKEVFISTLFSNTNLVQLNEIFLAYQNLYNKKIETNIENKFSEDLKEALITVGK